MSHSLLIVLLVAAAAGQRGADPADEFYRPDTVQTIHLSIDAADRQRMLAALPERIYVPGTFRWRDNEVDRVAIRYKGNSSSHPNQRHKRSLLVRFDKTEQDRRFLGMRRVSFDNGVQFGSLFSEPIITEILRDQGIPAHRCNYAKVFLNEEYQGVYVNVERIDESFIEQRLGNAKGALFKVDEGGPGCNLEYLGQDPRLYEDTFEPKSAAAKHRMAELVDFIRLIRQTEQADFARWLEATLAVDDFLRVTAVLLFSGAFDQLTGWNPHNYYLYYDPQLGRWRYLPWDLDVGFCETAFGRIQVLADWHAAWPVAPNGRPNPLLERITADPLLLQRYRDHARVILERYFEPQRIAGIIDDKYALIAQDLRADPFPHRRATVPGDRDYDGIVASMQEFMRKRYMLAAAQLERPGPRPAVVHRPGDRGPDAGRPSRFPPWVSPQLADKIQQVQRRAGRLQQAGHDISPIQALMQKLGPLVRQRNMPAAEELVNRALELAGERTPEGNQEAQRR